MLAAPVEYPVPASAPAPTATETMPSAGSNASSVVAVPIVTLTDPVAAGSQLTRASRTVSLQRRASRSTHACTRTCRIPLRLAR